MAANQARQLLQQAYVYEKKVIKPQCRYCCKQTRPICVYSLVTPAAEFVDINIYFFVVFVFYSIIFSALFEWLIYSSSFIYFPVFNLWS